MSDPERKLLKQTEGKTLLYFEQFMSSLEILEGKALRNNRFELQH